MAHANPIDAALAQDEAQVMAQNAAQRSRIAALLNSYTPQADNLLGFVLDMSYDEATLVTCDAWKRKCGGLPKNSFVLIRLNAAAAQLSSDSTLGPALILARVTQAVATPLSADVQHTIFTIHKLQAAIDPYTNAELQWGALQASILGTYYQGSGPAIEFGNDIDSYMSPHFYEVYMPTAEDLEFLLNYFVPKDHSYMIGGLRYTETQTNPNTPRVTIRISPDDFESNRTALFGKTRMGKSNTIKIITSMMIESKKKVGQVIFDLNGEYSNYNEQDGTSIFQLYSGRCVRYSLNPTSRTISGVPNPSPLKVNFFDQVSLGHSIITGLFTAEHQRSAPGYLLPLLEWDPVDEADLQPSFTEEGDRQRFIRARSMYFAALAKAGYPSLSDATVRLVLNQNIKQALAQNSELARVADIEDEAGKQPELKEWQRVEVAARIYEVLFRLYQGSQNTPAFATLFPASRRTGGPYMDPIHICLLRILGDTSILGTTYLIPFNKYHDLRGSHIVNNIVRNVNESKTVIIDLANSDEVVTRYYSDLICRAIFRAQTEKFTSGDFDEHSVLFYFEEAHNLFNKDDKDLRSIYNRLAKEGGKNRIGMVYATQSMTTLSPDLLKNTENFFIAHLNDDREINELTRRYEFRDIGLDVQRCRTKGYVRLITLSHRYALPVQVRKFGAEPEA